MSSFTTELKVSPLDEKHWILLEEFTYYLGTEDSGMYIRVPEGFVTDFASAPRIFWSILPPWGKYGKAAVLHDYMYRKISFIRLLCDSIFYEAMTVLGVSFWKKWLIYLFVRLIGWIPYRRYKKIRRGNENKTKMNGIIYISTGLLDAANKLMDAELMRAIKDQKFLAQEEEK